MAGSAVPVFGPMVEAGLFDAPDIQLDPEESHALAERKKGIDRLLEEQGLAKYKLEVMFSHRHTGRAPTPGTVTWWESGNKLHGGGDSKMYLCDNVSGHPELDGRGCKALIPDSANGLQFVVCPNCGHLWNPEYMVGEVFYRLSLQKWVDVLLMWYQRLEMRADIRVKYMRMGIREAQAGMKDPRIGGDLLRKSRTIEQRLVYIYPLKNIIKDTSAGADLSGRISALLKA